ncbi:hypothetical protein [Hymenobacter terrenus]|uniref:hypothetical protein n=1 Tax=Hymenobacter terrenus TaxID=1629124 RepID=UPI000619D77C|nr:hypothetical protein [Hymenobacter terrenus]
MPVTAYHVLYQTFTRYDFATTTQVRKRVELSEFYYQEDSAIVRFRELLKKEYPEAFKFISSAPSGEQVKMFLDKIQYYERIQPGTPVKQWRIERISIN